MARYIIFLSLLCALSVPAFSQAAVSGSTPLGAHFPEGLKGEVYGGFQWETFDTHNFLGLPGTISVPRQSLLGFHTSSSFALNRWLGVEGEISRNSQSYNSFFVTGDKLAVSSMTLLAGPRISYHLGPLAQFAHVLLGVDRLNSTYSIPSFPNASASSSPFTFAIGGGTTFRVSRYLGLATMADYIRPSTSPMPLNDIRVSFGPVFYFGRPRRKAAAYAPDKPAPPSHIQKIPPPPPACIEYMIDAKGNEWCLLRAGQE